MADANVDADAEVAEVDTDAEVAEVDTDAEVAEVGADAEETHAEMDAEEAEVGVGKTVKVEASENASCMRLETSSSFSLAEVCSLRVVSDGFLCLFLQPSFEGVFLLLSDLCYIFIGLLQLSSNLKTVRSG